MIKIKVVILGADNIYVQKIIGTVQELYKENGYWFVLGVNAYISEENFIEIEKAKNREWEEIKSIKKIKILKKMFGQKKEKKEKQIKTPKRQKKEKKKKERFYSITDERKEEFCNDYVCNDNKYLSKKYNCSIPTIWKYAKKFNVHRPPEYYEGVNVKNTNKIMWEEWMIEEIKKYKEERAYKKKEIIEILGIDFNTILLKIKELGLKPKPKLKSIKLSPKTVRIELNKLILQHGKRICSKCGRIKDITYFGYDKTANAYNSLCRDCKKISKWKKDGYEDVASPEDLDKMREYFNYSCAYCGKSLINETESIDHIVPRSQGGKHNIENLVISCMSCNDKKFTKSLEDFASDVSVLDNITNYTKIIRKKE